MKKKNGKIVNDEYSTGLNTNNLFNVEKPLYKKLIKLVQCKMLDLKKKKKLVFCKKLFIPIILAARNINKEET